MSLGIFEQWGDPKFVSAVQKILDTSIKHKIAPGIASGGDLISRVTQGFRFILVSVDTILLNEAAKSALERVKNPR